MSGKILVVGRRAGGRTLMESFLTHQVVQVRMAENGELGPGVRSTRSRADLVLLDMHMPVMDGSRPSSAWPSARPRCR